MKPKQVYMQQGDVILAKIDELPKTAQKADINQSVFILEKGEGVNTHELRSKKNLQECVCIYTDDQKRLYLHPIQKIELVHQEHGTSQIEQGMLLEKYKEREWDYETEEARAVMD